MKYLNDDIINLLRQKKVIEREEVVLKEGDLFVASWMCFSGVTGLSMPSKWEITVFGWAAMIAVYKCQRMLVLDAFS